MADPLKALLNDGHPRADDQAMAAARPQQRYDHRLRELVHRTGDPTIATDLGVPSRRPEDGSALRRPW